MNNTQHKRSDNSGAALIIVLAFLALLSVLAVFFLSRSGTDRQLAHGTFSETRADILARSALDIVVADVKQEIVDGSASPAPTFGPTASPSYLYTPKATAYFAPVPDGTPSDLSVPGLVKRSVRNDTPSSPAVGSRASAVNSATDASVNGRSVSAPRWNKHYLIPRVVPTPAADSDTTPTASFTPPDWVIVTRNGPLATGWTTALATPAPSNTSYAIGRYAYAIYDEGGLINANVAGYPSPAIPPANYTQIVGRKGLVTFADLTATGLSAGAISDLIGWRSYASSQPTGVFKTFIFDASATNRYLASVFANTNGNTAVPTAVWNDATDQVLPTRQSLIQFQRSDGFTVGALPYLGTFSKEVTTPSWAPEYNASQRGGLSTATYAYKNNAALATAINRDFGTVRVTQTFTRFDGSTAVVGEPLVLRRFPLNRLAWITYKGPSATLQIGKDVDPSIASPATSDPIVRALVTSGVALTTIRSGTAANIKQCFGLVWDTQTYTAPTGTSSGAGLQWVYTSPTSGNSGGTFSGATGTAATVIKTLAAVQSEAREPDFFELLKACILSGSVGQNTGGGTTNSSGGAAESPATFPDVHMSNSMHHLLKIGASIIDQSDPDSIPTRIRFDVSGQSWLALGVESLPYINAMCPVAGASAETPSKWATYLLFQLWDPNESIQTQPSVRLRVDGGVGIFNGNGSVWPNGGGAQATYIGSNSGNNVTIPAASTFGATAFPLTTSKVTATGVSQNAFVPVPVPVPGTDSSAKYVGFRLTDFTMPAGTSGQKPELWLQVGASNGGTPSPFNVTMEVDLGGGTWVPYNYFVGINATTSWISNNPMFVRAATAAAGTPVAFTVSPDSATKVPYCLMKADPRSTRFGVFQVDTNNSTTPASHARIDVPLWEASNSKNKTGFGGTVGSDVAHVPILFSGKPYLPATLCLNIGASSNSNTGYVDPDGVQRYADAGFSPQNGSGNNLTPYDTGYPQYNPVVLNRPFRNVAELGYSFRDMPWKSLDFFTDNSADAGLLDVFSISDEPQIVAGRVNLNTHQPAVVQAMLQGALWDEYDSSNLISTTNAGFAQSGTLASNYSSYTLQTGGTLTNRSSLATALNGSSDLPTKVLKPGNGVGHENEGAKTRREAIARSIASMGQTRTWNLLIDVIAQSGKYPPNATSLANFVVEGEKRYWLHVAIDRFTGEVIDQQLEAVYE